MKEIWDNIWGKDTKYNTSKFRKRTSEKVERITNKSNFNNSNILEIGCGDGLVLEKFSEIYNDINTTGIDISEYAIKSAINKKIKNSSFEIGDARNLKINDNIYDLVYSIGLIEHFKEFEDVMKCIEEKKRVLKKGGIAVIMVPNKLSFGRTQRKILESLNKWPFGFQQEFSPRELKKMMEDAGFTNIQVTSYNVYKPNKINSFYFIWLIDKIINFFCKDNYFHLYVRGEKN